MPCEAGYEWCKDKESVVTMDDKRLCVFHAPKEHKYKLGTSEKLSVEEFNRLVFDEIEHQKEATGKCDISGTVFPGDISFKGFDEKNPLPDISFIKAQFSGEVTFFGAQFSGETNFKKAQFSGMANFGRARFSGDASFWDARFSRGASFFFARFSGKTSFYGARFSVETSFSNARFSVETSFRSINVTGKLLFEKVGMGKISFIDTDLRTLDFINCWPDEQGRQVLYDETALKKDSSIADIKKVELLYRRLKQKYKEEHDETEVSNWHRGEKEMQRIGTKPTRNPFLWAMLNLYRISSGYGEEPLRAVVVLIAMILFSAFLLASFGLDANTDGITPFKESAVHWGNLTLYQYWKSLVTTVEYYTLQKVQLYKYQPVNSLGQITKIFFHVLIYIQATLFGFALRNRFRR